MHGLLNVKFRNTMSYFLLDGTALEQLRQNMALEQLCQNKKAAAGSNSNALYVTVPEECNSYVAEISSTTEIYRVMREQ
jgi:hypothetical protein